MDFILRFIGYVLAPFVKGSSSVIQVGDSAIKVSKPKLLVRLLYLFFRGRWTSPYESKEGMRRAMILRKIANLITAADKRIGRPVFAPPRALIIDSQTNRPALVTEWIDGEHISRQDALVFLSILEDVLCEAGLPTWSISPRNPMAQEDLRLVAGRIWCVDYESVLPNVLARVPSRHLDPIDLHSLLKRANCLKDYSGYHRLQEEIAELISLNGGID